MPPAIVDIIVETHRAPLPHVYQDLPRHELYSELHFPFLRQYREKKSAVDAMNREAEDQGEIDGAVGGRDNSAQWHLDTCPRGENNSRLEGDDAIRDGSSA